MPHRVQSLIPSEKSDSWRIFCFKNSQLRSINLRQETKHMSIVLIVEENEGVREYVKDHVLDWGHTVLEAGTGAGAIVAIRELQPDLVVMDVELPDMCGFDAVNLIRSDESTANTKVIALTALDSEEGRSKAKEAQFAHYLTKPIIDIDSLRDTMHAHL
ncbi:MAG: two-component system response regulator [Rhodospirillaceae bacterium]|nr:two-component system response regulator [Rhodospirillaceae bacterium]